MLKVGHEPTGVTHVLALKPETNPYVSPNGPKLEARRDLARSKLTIW